MTHALDPIIVAADGGGSGCRACAGTLSRGILAHARGGPGNVHSDFDGAVRNLTGAVREALAKAGMAEADPRAITAHFGVAGAHTPGEMAAVQAALPYGQTSVTGDRATSVRGVLGSADGYVVALGTGTIIARQDCLETRTVGGWGFDLSDQASGAWLGLRLCQETVLVEDGLRPATDLSAQILSELGGLAGLIALSTGARPATYAPLARTVVEAAAQGDGLGRDLMLEGAGYVTRALHHLGYAPGDLLSLAGGLGPHYAPYLAEDLTRNLQPPRGTALDGAFAMALEAVK
ncbi:MAG: BadF/BadG/BcrA/BcrD ATPase family protein [Pseudomonadota bacterium]